MLAKWFQHVVPYPHPETDKGALMSVRKFLTNAQVYYD